MSDAAAKAEGWSEALCRQCSLIPLQYRRQITEALLGFAAEQTAALRAALTKARATMDAAANIIRGLEDDPDAVRAALGKLDHGRQEAKTDLFFADAEAPGDRS